MMNEINIPFQHHQSAHCESGVTSNLLYHYGLKVSEPLAFGIGSGLFFAHIPFIKVNGIPATTYRVWPGQIFKKCMSRLDISYTMKSFRTEKDAFDTLDQLLEQQIPVGMLTSVFYLPYLPQAFRFRFNAHNIVVFGKVGNSYLVSDPVMDYTTTISKEDLTLARFAKGVPEPNGKIYYINKIPSQINIESAIFKGIKQTSSWMTKIVIPIFGAKGISYLANKLIQYPHKYDQRKTIQYLGNIIRMQEEIGTGGAGFRFMYAAFLQEASKILNRTELSDASKRLTAIGDLWRNFAYESGKICKQRTTELATFNELAALLKDISKQELNLFNELFKFKLK